MELQTAEKIAKEIKSELAPYCDRVEIAGSVRRKKPFVNDIEIVCIPQKHVGRHSNKFCMAVHELGTLMKGYKKGIHNAKYIRLWMPDKSIHVDLFMVKTDNWGLQFLIRTGSAEFSHSIMRLFNIRGYSSKNGYPQAPGKLLKFSEETEVFNFLNLSWIDPEKRQEGLKFSPKA